MTDQLALRWQHISSFPLQRVSEEEPERGWKDEAGKILQVAESRPGPAAQASRGSGTCQKMRCVWVTSAAHLIWLKGTAALRADPPGAAAGDLGSIARLRDGARLLSSRISW